MWKLIKTAGQFLYEFSFMHSRSCQEYLQLLLACEIRPQNKVVEINYHKDYELASSPTSFQQNTLLFLRLLLALILTNTGTKIKANFKLTICLK